MKYSLDLAKAISSRGWAGQSMRVWFDRSRRVLPQITHAVTAGPASSSSSDEGTMKAWVVVFLE